MDMKRIASRSAGVGMALALACAGSAQAETVAKVASPDGGIAVAVELVGGRASYRIDRNDTAVLDSSRLGLLLDSGRLERNLAYVTSARDSHDESWEQPWGEQRLVRNHYNELRVSLKETLAPQRAFDVVFRVFADGVGFRYEFPEDAGRQVGIRDELTEFNVAREGEAWWIPAGGWNREEYLYHRTPIAEAAYVQTPITMRLDNGTHVAIHEAALVDYAGMNLVRGEGRRFTAALTPSALTPAKVVRQAPFHTPWRTVQITPDAAGLVASKLILNLNEPNKLGDVSWFKPMKYAGVWWEMHLDTKSWSSGKKHGATNANVRRHIDFAAKNGFGGVLVEGWNVGWDGDWFGNGSEFDFSKSYPDFDLEKLAAYAAGKGVQLIGHHETAANAAHYEAQMEDGFALYARNGIHAVKTGYVSDAGDARVLGADGKVHFALHESQEMARHYLKVVTEAARHRIAINAHEPLKSTGLQRTYPNWIATEGARGMEYNAWGEPPNPPEHELNLVYTRMLGGPMDFTPGVLSLVGARGMPIQSTLAKQLALYVVIYSPIQMVPDLPEHYAKHPAAFQFIKDVAVDWDETRVLNGEVGDYVTIARRERGGRDWFLGSITDENPRALEIALDFLAPGIEYRAEVYRDGDNAAWDGDRFAFKREEKTVRQGDQLAIKLAPGGGQAIHFSPR